MIETGLAHCKHLKTVREHLSGLVYSGEVINPVPAENEKYLTAEFWEALTDHEKVSFLSANFSFDLSKTCIRNVNADQCSDKYST